MSAKPLPQWSHRPGSDEHPCDRCDAAWPHTELECETTARRQRASATVPFEVVLTRIVRAELRRCGLRPPAPAGPGVWEWDAAADAWVEVGT